ncbi:MAG TPA: hypothetical protein VG944_13105 [Fimbriimonas sp.]|nr:hypothetical protein [Fimbriimonas sp.]
MSQKKVKAARRAELRAAITPPSRPILDLRVLSVGHGDMKISFDSANPQELERAKKVVTDLLRQGYAIMVEVGRNDKGPIYQRATGFDPETMEYLVVGDPPVDATFRPPQSATSLDAGPVLPPSTRGRGRPRGPSRVPASSPSVAVARTAGGYDPNLPGRIVRGGWSRA